MVTLAYPTFRCRRLLACRPQLSVYLVSKIQTSCLPLLLLSDIRNRFEPASKLPSSLLHQPISSILSYSGIRIHPQEV